MKRGWDGAILAGFFLCFADVNAMDSALQAPHDPGAAQEVNIVAFKNPERLSYQAYARGMDAAERLRALAPQAEIGLRLISLSGKALSLELVDDAGKQAIELDTNGRFTLHQQREPGKEAYLVASASAGKARFEPVVQTPGLAPSVRRLGDLRLECEMQWAMIKDELPLVMRATFKLAGGICHSKKIPMQFTAGAKLNSAVLVEGARTLNLTLTPKSSAFYAPVHDRGWGNDAHVVLEFAPAEP
ncbi:hypothetical protein KY495_10400 [Massilia sp. PAMC28688]|uniref:hypothetical protein n=1 Tax=Massilia sp. PAMC28688 TaxID=2861283 RepID=UPI001C635400|nr:hypothetical protein [Massilia sp. PAMC28688]QYF95515.1 hypothetical protein KY495_10400 [Massilia sp. PAMC28688]